MMDPTNWRVVAAAGAAWCAYQAVRTLRLLLVERQRVSTSAPAAEVAAAEYDFVVVGGGSAGAVLAARLVEDPSVRVLLLEAGTEDTHSRGGGFFKVPIAALGFKATDHHWGYETESEPELVMRGQHWAPCEGECGRPLIQTRGKVLGGSSSINLCNYIRCHPDDLNGWKLRGWSFREMLGYFRRAEALDTAASADGRESPATPRSPHDAPIAVGDIRAPHAISLAFVAGLGRWLGRRVMAPMLQVLRVTTA